MIADHDRDLIAGAALGALEPADESRLSALLERADAAAELDLRRATVAALEAGLPRAAPSDDLFARILAEIEPARVVSLRRARWAPRIGAGLAAAAAVVLGLVVLTGSPGEPDARAAVSGTPAYADVSGTATLEDGELVLDLENVPAPPSGHHYEVWVLRTEGGGGMEAVGSFTPDGDDARLELSLPGPGDYKAVDVSVEPDGGPAEHSSVSLAGGSFGS
ncbi:MAG TPA: anti-sigma factor [Gaiellaceae bacterium]|nr:anti-sigma factor [Gaiellaceae bacterium]